MKLLLDLQMSYSCQLYVTTNDGRVLPNQIEISVREHYSEPLEATVVLIADSRVKESCRFQPNDKTIRWRGEIMQGLTVLKVPRYVKDDVCRITAHCYITEIITVKHG